MERTLFFKLDTDEVDVFFATIETGELKRLMAGNGRSVMAELMQHPENTFPGMVVKSDCPHHRVGEVFGEISFYDVVPFVRIPEGFLFHGGYMYSHVVKEKILFGNSEKPELTDYARGRIFANGNDFNLPHYAAQEEE